MGKPVTLAQIASEAGVSTPTVSRVVNGYPLVARDTRERVERLLQKYGYRRRTRRDYDLGPLVGLIFTDIEDLWAMDVIRGAESAAHNAGAGITISVLREHRKSEQAWLRQIAEHGISGLVVVRARPSDSPPVRVYARSLPVVVVDPGGAPYADVPSIFVDERSGALAATRHLLHLGHRRIALVGHAPDLPADRARLEGHRTALETAGLKVAPELIRYADAPPSFLDQEVHALLSLDDPPTAIFASSDLQALGIMQAARRRGLRVPEDLSIVGVGDTPLARVASPPLTTIRQPFRQMGARAVRMVLVMGNDGEPRHRSLDLTSELVCRASTASPRL